MITKTYRESLAQRFDCYKAAVLNNNNNKKKCHMFDVLRTPLVGIGVDN